MYLRKVDTVAWISFPPLMDDLPAAIVHLDAERTVRDACAIDLIGAGVEYLHLEDYAVPDDIGSATSFPGGLN